MMPAARSADRLFWLACLLGGGYGAAPAPCSCWVLLAEALEGLE